jgi:hypothetical protein
MKKPLVRILGLKFWDQIGGDEEFWVLTPPLPPRTQTFLSLFHKVTTTRIPLPPLLDMVMQNQVLKVMSSRGQMMKMQMKTLVWTVGHG